MRVSPPPARLTKSPFAKSNGFYANGYFVGKRERYSTFVEEKPKVKRNVYQLAELLTQEGWSLASVDEAVRKKFAELLYKSGRIYIRIL